jgi:hypothetical protein
VFQNAVDVRDGFVQILDHSVGGMICRLCQAAQLRLILHRQVQVQIHRIAHFLREGFSTAASHGERGAAFVSDPYE